MDFGLLQSLSIHRLPLVLAAAAILINFVLLFRHRGLGMGWWTSVGTSLGLLIYAVCCSLAVQTIINGFRSMSVSGHGGVAIIAVVLSEARTTVLIGTIALFVVLLCGLLPLFIRLLLSDEETT